MDSSSSRGRRRPHVTVRRPRQRDDDLWKKRRRALSLLRLVQPTLRRESCQGGHKTPSLSPVFTRVLHAGRRAAAIPAPPLLHGFGPPGRPVRWAPGPPVKCWLYKTILFGNVLKKLLTRLRHKYFCGAFDEHYNVTSSSSSSSSACTEGRRTVATQEEGEKGGGVVCGTPSSRPAARCPAAKGNTNTRTTRQSCLRGAALCCDKTPSRSFTSGLVLKDSFIISFNAQKVATFFITSCRRSVSGTTKHLLGNMIHQPHQEPGTTLFGAPEG